MQQPTMMHSPEEQKEDHSRMVGHLSAAGHNESLWNSLYCEALASHLGVSAAEQKCLDLLLVNRDKPNSSPMTPRQVARAVNLTPGAITGVLSRLESAGYVTRKHDLRDRRRILIILNEERIEADIGPLRETWDGSVQQLCARYSESELRVAMEFIQDWTTMLQRQTESLRGPTGLIDDGKRMSY